MSTSMLSRLESGKRKPTLELLLPLAGISTPPIGDSRIHITPHRIHG